MTANDKHDKRHRGFYLSDTTVKQLRKLKRKNESMSGALTRIVQAWGCLDNQVRYCAEIEALEKYEGDGK